MKVGILGGGQLGRMIALAGVPLGISCRALDPSRDAPIDGVAVRVMGEFEDYAALADFVSGIDAVTYEFENVPGRTARWLAERVPVFPPTAALEVAQDRLIEKEFFRYLGVPVPAFRAVESRAELDAAIREVGLPAVLKTRRFGYDGKGQERILTAGDVDPVWLRLGGRPLILEQLVNFQRELSLLAVGGAHGATVFYPLVENYHEDGILRRSLAPAANSTALQQVAEEIARQAIRQLNYVGVLAIEFFDVAGKLFVNEMAPRVHNSGHWTIEGAMTSQFENHLRAGAGWPLGETRALGFAAMVNLIGTLPDAEAVLAVPGAHLHLYGKSPRPNRKLGHVTLMAANERDRTERMAQLELVMARNN